MDRGDNMQHVNSFHSLLPISPATNQAMQYRARLGLNGVINGQQIGESFPSAYVLRENHQAP